MSFYEVLFRIILATLMSGIIGYEREYKNRPAGVKTHILVCLGAASFAILERFLAEELMHQYLDYPEMVGGFSLSMGRLVAQVISGIGFLGAGTIIITKHNILGLTTAASIWIVACLGIVIGYGVYTLAIPLFLTIIVTLVILKRFLRMNSVKKFEIKYHNRIESKEFMLEYFKSKEIVVKDIDFYVEVTDQGNIYTDIYTLDMSKGLAHSDVIDDISRYGNIIRIRCITI